MTIFDDYKTVVDFWKLYKRISALHKDLGGHMWPDAVRMCGTFGEQRGRLAVRLCWAMLDEFEERERKGEQK